AAFATLAVVLLDGAGEGGRFAARRRILALVAGVFAGFGVASGLIIWPVLVWGAWRGCLSRGWIIAVAVVGAATIALYVTGLSSHDALGALDLARLERMADYATRFLGLPWSHAPQLRWFGRIAGAILGVAGLSLVLWR